jgi:hypothetical protein
MTDERRAPIDRAVETATHRTRTAEDDYLETPIEDADALRRAAEVERRAEDLAVLTGDPPDDAQPSKS